jgi:hypothetical protein
MIPIRLADLQRLDLPVSETVAGRIGYPHEAFMCFDYAVAARLPDDGRDAVVLISKTGRGTTLQMIADHPGRVVVVAAPGDAPFKPVYLPERALPANVVALYATSNLVADDRIRAVPLGIRTSNVQPAKFVRQSVGRAERDLLLGNFTLNADHYRPGRDGRPHVRARLVERLARAPWARLDVSSEPRTDARALFHFYGQLARHRFVLSPEGNGIDCYRHWEALAMGAVPIVMRSRAMAPFEGLPILFTDDYGELSPGYLEEQWTAMAQRTFDLEPLLMSSHRRRFLRSVAELDEPCFICLEPGGHWSPRFLRALRRSPRSGAPTEVEVPVPPFLRADSLSEPGAWRPFGDAAVSIERGVVSVTAGDGEASGARQRFAAVEGVRFRVRGRACGVEGRAAARLVVTQAIDGPDTASAALVAGEPFEVEFEAPAGRLWLELRMEPGEGERALALDDIEVAALV